MSNKKIEKSNFLLEEMNAVDVKNKIDENTIAITVFGACENHGDHMPFGSDFIFPMELAKRISAKHRNCILLPLVPYGVSNHHNEIQMTISLDANTIINLIQDILSSIIKHGIKRILILNGHDGNIAPLEIASRKIKDQHPKVTIACLESWWELIGNIKNNLFEEWKGYGHGGEAETSGMLAVRPDLVDMKQVPDTTIPNLPENVRIYWKINELTNTGATGASKLATEKKGQITLEILEDLIISFIDNMDQNNWKYGIKL